MIILFIFDKKSDLFSQFTYIKPVFVFFKVSKAMIELSVEARDRTDIGMNLEAAKDLMQELLSFKEKTKVRIFITWSSLT